MKLVFEKAEEQMTMLVDATAESVPAYATPAGDEAPHLRKVLCVWGTILCRIALAGVFFYAGFIKILNPADFALMVSRYRLLPDSAVSSVAIVLPWIEVVTALLLLFSAACRRSAAIILLGLMMIFTIALCLNAWRGISVDCGCFSTRPGAPQSAAMMILRDFGLTLLAAICVATSPAINSKTGDSSLAGRLSIPDRATRRRLLRVASKKQ